MREILSKLFGFFKIFLFMISLGMILYGVLITYSRLGKSLLESVPIFIPFVFVLITFLISLTIKNKKDFLFFNFVATIVFITIIIICLRAKYDNNMILYYKYKIGFNPTFFSDNLSIIEAMLYMLGLSNVFLIISHKIKKEKTIEKDSMQISKESVKKIEEVIEEL